MQGIFVQLANAVVAVWRGRSAFSQPSMFGDPEAGRRSRFWVTLIAVIVTILALAIAAGAVYLLWSAFTSYQRHHPS
jgi:hypothetical protein